MFQGFSVEHVQSYSISQIKIYYLFFTEVVSGSKEVYFYEDKNSELEVNFKQVAPTKWKIIDRIKRRFNALIGSPLPHDILLHL